MHRFETSYRRHLVQEQRRAVLEALAQELHAEATVGEVLDAARSLGWHEHMGDLSLQDLADALLEDEAAAGAEDEDEDAEDELDEEVDEEDEEDEEDELDEEEEQIVVEEPAPRSAKKRSASKKASKKKTSKKAGAKKTSKKAGAKKTSKKTGAKKTSKKAGAKKTSKKAGAKKTSKKSGKRGSFKGALDSRRLRALKSRVDADDPMSLDEAAELFVPLVEQMGQATMQDLEELTSIGRRKLRFHIGQLVRNGYLERNGMGRGTFYTAV